MAVDRGETQIEIYEGESGGVHIRIDGAHETGWVTQANMAALFGIDRSAISKKIIQVFGSGELDPKSNVQFWNIANSDKPVKHYSLDVVLAVGYQVNSKLASHFRRWVASVLQSYVSNGFAINEKKLRDSPAAQRELARQLRKIRLSEQEQYLKVREVFKLTASDYDKDSPQAKQFFGRTQDKFHFAITEKTAVQIIIERADGRKPMLGMRNAEGDIPHIADAQVAKNYLDEDELTGLENLCEQWMLFAESKSFRGQKLTMEELSHRLNSLLEFNGYRVLYDYPNVTRTQANAHVQREMDKFKALQAPKPAKAITARTKKCE